MLFGNVWRTYVRLGRIMIKAHGRAYVSTQIWGMLHISFKSFPVDITEANKKLRDFAPTTFGM